MVDNLSVGYLPWRHEAHRAKYYIFGPLKKKKKKKKRKKKITLKIGF
jgi:hypothetical protein